jgi:hypothetical protein
MGRCLENEAINNFTALYENFLKEMHIGPKDGNRNVCRHSISRISMS